MIWPESPITIDAIVSFVTVQPGTFFFSSVNFATPHPCGDDHDSQQGYDVCTVLYEGLYNVSSYLSTQAGFVFHCLVVVS
jgi:hypothetical protein